MQQAHAPSRIVIRFGDGFWYVQRATYVGHGTVWTLLARTPTREAAEAASRLIGGAS